MSLRIRLPAPADHPAIAWSDRVRALAEIHRSRRAIDDTSRWPLAHACTHARHAGGPSSAGRAPVPFCCRALA
jgi:hypothetical protein